MEKEKKISIRYYINTSKKPLIKNGVHFFPLYAKIGFNKESTSIKAYSGLYEDVFLNPNEFNDHNNIPENSIKKEASSIVLNADKIDRIIRFEYNLVGEKYTLKKLGSRIGDFYNTPLSLIFNIRFIFQSLMIDVPDRLAGFLFIKNNSLSSLYYHLKYYDQNLKNKLSDNHQKAIVLYSLLSIYSETSFEYSILDIEKSDKCLKVYDWIEGQFKKGFIEFLNELDYKQDVLNKANFKNKDLLIDFPFHAKDINSYIKTLNETIARQLLSYVR